MTAQEIDSTRPSASDEPAGPDGVVVRPVREPEFETVGDLIVAAYLAGGFLTDEKGYAAVLRDVAGRAREADVLVAADAAGELLGSVTVAEPGGPYAEVGRPGELEFRMLGVAPAAQGRGVGRALVDAVVCRAHAIGARRVVLSSLDRMATAHRLYGRLGFRRTPERDWAPVPDVRLLTFALDVRLASTSRHTPPS